MTTQTQDNRSPTAGSTASPEDGIAGAAGDCAVLQVEGLRVQYGTPSGPVKAVDGVTFALRPGERFGLVGESGSGKTTTAFALMRLIEPPGEITGGRAILGGVDLLKLSDEKMRQARFAQIALIPQGAMNSLNPVMRIGQQVADTIKAHESGSRERGLEERIGGLLESVGLSVDVGRMYPHELSGGMKQRACIAMAISLRPSVILADEPTSALDVVVQRQVLQTLRRVQEDLGASIIFVGHDMGLMAQFVDRIGVMYAGKLVEIGPVEELFTRPKHPYTQLLIGSLPNLDSKGSLRGIPGMPPSLLRPPGGCAFHPRCPKVLDHCPNVTPELRQDEPEHWVSCHLFGSDQ